MDQFAQGSTAYTEAMFVDDNGAPVDPANLLVDRIGPIPDETVLIANVAPTRIGVGLYRYTGFLPADATIGVWRDHYHGDGGYVGDVPFEVTANLVGDFISVADAALLETGFTFSLFAFADDASFKAWINHLAQRSILFLSDKVGSSWSLDTPDHFDAATYEVISRMIKRLLLRNSSIAASQGTSFRLGNFSVSRIGGQQSTVADLVRMGDEYHRMALSLIGQASSYAGIKVITVAPEDRSFVL